MPKTSQIPVFCSVLSKNTVNTVFFATRSKRHRKYRGFALPMRKKKWRLRCFLLREFQKTRKHRLFDNFNHYETEKKAAGVTTTTTTSNNNNNNNSNSTLVYGLRGAKSQEICGVFCPEGFL